MSVLGVGIDVVDVAGFRTQLADTASGFVAATFTPGERRDAERPAGDRAERLAARFAAKEAFVKAWSGARYGRPPAVATVDPCEIEVVLDGYGRPGLRLHGAVRDAVTELAGARAGAGAGAGAVTSAVAGGIDIGLSLSHDGGVATAIVVLSSRPDPPMTA